MKEERLSGALQENILTLLVFDDKACKLIRGSVTPQLFESAVFREVAGHAIDFIDQFGEAIKDHLADSLEGILEGSDKRKASSYKRLVDNLFLARDSVNAEYVISQLHKFVRQQNLKSAVVRAVEAIEDGRIDAAEVELQKGLSSQVNVFEAGLVLNDAKQVMAFLEEEEQPLLTGIEELDRRGVGLARKEMLVVMAPAGHGKSWALMHLGKWAILQRQTVVHITLEMSDKKTAQRYLQSFFAISKREAKVKLPTLQKNESGAMTDVFYEEVERKTMRDPNIRAVISHRITREFRRRPPLVIKEFPTGSLTMPQLRSYLDGLERYHKIVPDVLIVDYPDLMAMPNEDVRLGTGQIYRELRGLAVERNFALGVASQSNREGAKAKMVEATHAAEDYSKVQTADNILTYSQTPMEKKLGLARLFSAKARNDEGAFIALITQAYGMGQFALDSAHLGYGNYWDYLAKGGKWDRDDRDDDE